MSAIDILGLVFVVLALVAYVGIEVYFRREIRKLRQAIADIERRHSKMKL